MRKVLINGHETCGLIRDLSCEFRKRKWEVLTIAKTDNFFSSDYDYDQYNFVEDYLAKHVTRHQGLQFLLSKLYRLVGKVSPWIAQKIDCFLRTSLHHGIELYVQVWAGVPFQEELLKDLKRKNVPSIVMMMGSDIRDYNVFVKQFLVEQWNFDEALNAPGFVEKLGKLRSCEQYATCIHSVPDQMGLALRPYKHLQVPIDLSCYKFEIPARRVPLVVHAPSRPEVKGTDIIQSVLAGLQADGVEFELQYVRDLPHEKMAELLTNADVVVDELVFNGPGWLGFEAMASGCAVATRFYMGSPSIFRPPIWSIDPCNIRERLLTLLQDFGLRQELAAAGREYVERNNTIGQVVDNLQESVFSKNSFQYDYFPNYLRNTYVPTDADEMSLLNSYNQKLKNERWYRKYVGNYERAGLVF